MVGFEPEDERMQVGIIEPDGGSRYVSGTGEIDHTFEIKETGSYRVFIRNQNSVSVIAVGKYTKK